MTGYEFGIPNLDVAVNRDYGINMTSTDQPRTTITTIKGGRWSFAAALAVGPHVRVIGRSITSATQVERWSDQGAGLVTRIGTAVDGRTVVDLRLAGGYRNTILADEIEIVQLAPGQAAEIAAIRASADEGLITEQERDSLLGAVRS